MSSVATQKHLLTIAEACRVLGIGRTSFYGLVKAKKLTLIKIGRRSLVRDDLIDRFIEELSDGR